MEKLTCVILPMLLSFAGTAVTLRFLIPVLKSKKMGQRILEIGPRWHKSKEGTPTMGGISFMLLISVCTLSIVIFLLFSGLVEEKAFYGVLLTVLYALVNGIIGITDDGKKLKKKKNEGLTAGEKYLLQLSAAILYTVLLIRLGVLGTSVFIPILNKPIEVNLFWYPLAVLFLTGFGNAVNLTDGIDGLCGSVSGAVAVFLLILSLTLEELGFAVLSSALFGGMLGFLVYNLHPARVFMGDTGSLFLGALISGAFLSLGQPILLFTVGIVYLIEAASVIIQVIVFKLTGKRVFLMAPMHHHLEKKGMSEGKITLFAVILTAMLSLVSFMLFV